MTLPSWAVATPERRGHIERVAALLDEWARAMGVSDAERARWVKAAWLHDALRDEQRSDELAHGPRAAARAAHDGERDRGVLDAVRYHTVGYVHRSEEHTSELQSLAYLVCRLLLEKKKNKHIN